MEKAEPLIAPLVPGGGLFRIEDIAEVSYVTPWRGSGTLFEIGMVWRDWSSQIWVPQDPLRPFTDKAHESNTFVEIGSGTLAQLSDEGKDKPSLTGIPGTLQVLLPQWIQFHQISR